MSLVLIPKSIKEIEQSSKLVNAYILGIKDLSVNLPIYFTLEEIKKIRSLTKNDIFISLNKNMHCSNIKILEKTLIELEEMDIKGIIYYDIALVSLKEKLNLKKDLIWNQEHLSTNALTSNFWFNENVKYTYLASEITLEEIISISREAKSTLMINIFGYIPMFTSKRHLIKNYLDNFNLTNTSKINYLYKEEKEYPIIDELNTTVYTANILNGIKEHLILKDKIDYFVINSFNIDEYKIMKVLELFNNANEENISEYYNKINKMFDNVDLGFFYKETIYKVVK